MMTEEIALIDMLDRELRDIIQRADNARRLIKGAKE